MKTMFKEFLLKKMLQHKLKNVPQEERERLLRMFETNPELFEKIAKEIQQKVKEGKDQMNAAVEVMSKYKSELQALNNK